MAGTKTTDEIRQLFASRLREASAGSFWAVVKSVDEKRRICIVSDEGVDYDEVLLYAVDDRQRKGFCFIPSPGSTVLVSRIGGSNNLFVAMFSVVDKVLVTIGDQQSVEISAKKAGAVVGDTTLKATDKGLTLSRGAAGLKKTLTDLCGAIERLTVTTGVGPSGVPINAMDFTKIKQELNDYLEG